MKTLLMKVNPNRPSQKKIEAAAEIIMRGGLVAFPTETVYGLGANALDGNAVKKIYEAKGRPLDNPVIVHIADIEELGKVAVETRRARDLMEKFWPGPLTLVLRKSKSLPRATTAGLDTVAVRMPRNKVALDLIASSSVPIAAPSANISGGPSPTSAEHVLQDLAGRIDAVLDGGETKIGVESTVLDLTSPIPIILRPGGVTAEELEEVIGRIRFAPPTKGKPRSPGMKYRHYAPRARMILVEGSEEEIPRKIQALIDRYKGERIGILASKENAPYYRAHAMEIVGSRKDLHEVAQNLFGALRSLDAKSDVIIAEGFDDIGIGRAVMNRLRKAASKRIIVKRGMRP